MSAQLQRRSPGSRPAATTRTAPRAPAPAPGTANATGNLTGDLTGDLVELAARAFLWGYPLVTGVGEVLRFTAGSDTMPPAVANQFTHAATLATPATRFVSVNNDSIYSLAQLDLGNGPVRLDVPDTDGAYYVLQLIDAWTHNFAYVGTLGTGTEAQSYLIVPPGYDDVVPDDLAVIRAPTRVVTIVGRFGVDGPADLPRVHALQRGLRLTALGEHTPVVSVPEPHQQVAPDLVFWEQLRVWVHAFPPVGDDLAFLQELAALEVLTPDAHVDPYPRLREALVAGERQGRELLEAISTSAEEAGAGGWTSNPHAFDYNVDHLDVGTIDDPAWKIADPDVRVVTRAVVARVGLWGNHGYEATYCHTFVDSDGTPLNFAHRYRITFPAAPPVEQFWSLTMYGRPDYFLVDNPIGRYAIGDRTPDLVWDGESLTLHLQAEDPGPDHRANWLPTPMGDFRPILRLYGPTATVLDGSYQVPPIIRCG
ncbi:DUF1254 domain-containing protein [soil metagenome]